MGNLQLNNHYNSRDINELFDELDYKSEGKIEFNEFIKIVLEKTLRVRRGEKFSDFYSSAKNFYLTPSEHITDVIRRAINRINKDDSHYEEDKELTKNLEWVIKALTEKDLFDFRLKENLFDKETLETNDTLKFLSEFSNDVFKQQKKADLELVISNASKKKATRDCNNLYVYLFLYILIS